MRDKTVVTSNPDFQPLDVADDDLIIVLNCGIVQSQKVICLKVRDLAIAQDVVAVLGSDLHAANLEVIGTAYLHSLGLSSEVPYHGITVLWQHTIPIAVIRLQDFNAWGKRHSAIHTIIHIESVVDGSKVAPNLQRASIHFISHTINTG